MDVERSGMSSFIRVFTSSTNTSERGYSVKSIRASLVGTGRRELSLDETEAGLNALIERRAANREHADDAQTREDSWKESVRQHHAERREANRYLWIHHYRTLARNHAALSERFEDKATALTQETK